MLRIVVAAAMAFVAQHALPNPWLLGWSFGTDLALRYGCDPAVVGGRAVVVLQAMIKQG